MRAIGLLNRKSSLFAAATFALARLLQVVMTFAVARTLDKELAGVTFYIFGLITFAQAVSALGLENYGNYIFPRRRRRGRLHKMWGYLFLIVCLAVPINVLIALSVYTFPEIGALPIAPYVIAVIALSSTLGAVRRLARLIFVGLGERARALVHESISYYVILLAIFLPYPDKGIASISTIVLIAAVISFGWAIWDISRALPRPPRGYRSEFPRYRSARVTTSAAFPSFIAQSAPLLLNRADVLLLAPLASASEVAIYSVAIRLTFLLSTLVELTTVVWGTRLMNVAELDRSALRRLFRSVILVTSGITLVVSTPLIVFAEPCLTLLFGSGYANAAGTLVILVIGKLLTAPFQPLLVSLVALGYNRGLARILVIAAVTCLALNPLLIPIWGALGCAIASTVAMAVMSLGYSNLVRKVLTH